MSNTPMQLQEVLTLPMEARVPALVGLSSALVAGEAGEELRQPLITALLDALHSGQGAARDRLDLGDALAALGDPRLRVPTDDDYWAEVDGEDGPLLVGKHLVTNAEFAAFVAAGGYKDRGHWSETGWAWLETTEDPWPTLAVQDENATLVGPNQPVVGVSYWEAEAYSAAFKARLPRFDERMFVVRGEGKRPYPWGAPFGEGNANTREEALGRTCAVGLYVRDVTPEGVADLAGNAAEWTADDVGDEKLMHPGAWDQPSMASWAKAKEIVDPGSRWAGLGFRLVRDAN